MRRAIATLAVTALWGLMAPWLQADGPVSLTVRLYNTAGAPAQDLLTARRVAEGLLRDTGMGVAFRLCGSPSPGLATLPCDEPLKRAEVVVRVIPAPAESAGLHPDTFGMAYVVRATSRGWLATVFSDRVAHAASRVGVSPGPLLGRAIAHEVGHLLLGIGYHGETGLMRAAWPDEFLRGAPDDWYFTLDEAARMQRSLVSAF